MKFAYAFLIWLICLPTFALGAVQDFTIKWYGVDDTTPPTTPTLVTAEPISEDQIDLVWTSAVDNYLLGGYVVSRDGLPVATTSLTTYSDSGLVASTTYAYSVVAFDAFFNTSAASNILATTTLPALVIATTTEPARVVSGTKTIILEHFSTEVTTQSATLAWQTNLAARYMIRWGRTDLYDAGYIRNDTYKLNHETEITALEPGTSYLYEITAYSAAGAVVVLKKGTLITASLPADEAVANVAKLVLEARGQDVYFTYTVPPDVAIETIRIVRNHLGYPSNSTDGAVVYDGLATTFTDVGALTTHPTQFYTVFVVAKTGTISSGAVGVVSLEKTEERPEDVVVSTTTASSSEPEMVLTGLEMSMIKLFQLGREHSFFDTTILLSYKDSFTLKIPIEALPRHLKSIVVTLLDPTNQRQSYSFLLRLNKDQTAYEATIAPLYVRGVSRLQVQVFDYDRQSVGLYRKQIDFVVLDSEAEPEVIFPDALLTSLRYGLWPGLFLGVVALLLFWLLLMRRSRKAEDNS
jgi:hypothetical protein